jgi:outer membrane receptor protein involved in Fe transport
VDFDAALIPVRGLQLGVRAAYVDGTYDDDVTIGNYAGQGLLNTPKWALGTNVEYTHDLGSHVGRLALSADLNYTGWQPVNYNPTGAPDPHYQLIGGFALLDSTLRWEEIAGSQVDARLYVENLTDRRPPIYGFDIRNTVGTRLTHITSLECTVWR